MPGPPRRPVERAIDLTDRPRRNSHWLLIRPGAKVFGRAWRTGRAKGRVTLEHASRLERTGLVVDDDAFVVSALAELLEEDGYDVYTASNGFSAMRQVLEVRASVMLVDLALPDRFG